MPLSRSENLIFIHIPKNAGTAITEALPAVIQEGHHPYNFYQRKYPVDQYDVFTVVRHPLDRFVSCFEYAQMKKSYWHSDGDSTQYGLHPDYEYLEDDDFEECVEKYYSSPEKFSSKHWKPQTDWLPEQEEGIKILKYEGDIEQQIEQEMGVSLDLQVVNQTDKEKQDWREYYTEQLAWRIFMCYRDDFKRFDYELPEDLR